MTNIWKTWKAKKWKKSKKLLVIFFVTMNSFYGSSLKKIQDENFEVTSLKFYKVVQYNLPTKVLNTSIELLNITSRRNKMSLFVERR